MNFGGNIINEIISVGIDIGTTTTQIIFSKLSIQNTASLFLVPEVKITDKKIIYKSKIYFTPLLEAEKIDLVSLKLILDSEYENANVRKSDISTGAVIITGETSRKKNAEEVIDFLSAYAGDFVVATAGPDLEAILAGHGSGAAELSKNVSKKIVNLDIGGGTTNVSIFWDGENLDAFALDIGGRLIRFDTNGKVIYISPKLVKLISNLNLDVKLDSTPSFVDLKKLTDTLAKVFFDINEDQELEENIKELFITHPNKGIFSEIIMFSGGVAEFIYSDDEILDMSQALYFGDMGPLLGNSIRTLLKNSNYRVYEPAEKIRATVIGAGSHSMKISGSTILYDEDILPLKNIPIIKINDVSENLSKKIITMNFMYDNKLTAIAFKGPKSPSYLQIKNMAESISLAFSNNDNPILIIVENDFAKALGQTLKLIFNKRNLICLDNIKVDTGNYIDIGSPISGIIPVVVKTLIFRN